MDRKELSLTKADIKWRKIEVSDSIEIIRNPIVIEAGKFKIKIEENIELELFKKICEVLEKLC